MTRTTSAARRSGLLVLPPVLLLALAACSPTDPGGSATSAPRGEKRERIGVVET